MKLICTQDNFKKAIYNTERIVSKQNTLPILNNILFEAKKGFLVFSATNLEMGAQVKVGVKVEKEGKITIPAKIISSFSNNLPQGDNVLIESVEQGIKIKSGSFKAIIKGVSADDFPLIPKKSSEYLLNINSIDLKNILSKEMVSVAQNEARQELTGINLILSQKEIFFASTDSFRLSESRISINKENINKEVFEAYINKKDSIIIPFGTLNEVMRIISNNEECDVKITIESGQIFFEIEETKIVSRLINGKYPEYKHIMPKDYKTRVVLEKSVFQNAVKMANIFASGKSGEISIKIDSGVKKIFIGASSAETGENSTELKFDVSGPSQEVILNSKYLLDGINSISTSKVAFLMNSESTPIALKEINEQTGEVLHDFTYIVMPIKN
ncbi:MAG TPA: DNA polymerase III subunit beta [Candidatus Moranbacteria bacterium]|nr:DNA polymerase III subunit beta [Candidatus Moranbacteria bacterium]